MENLIGNTAGEIWRLLEAEGPMTVSGLVKRTQQSQSVVNMAVGWLAREGKIAFSQSKRGLYLSLKGSPQSFLQPG